YFNPDGTLVHKDFLEIVIDMKPYYILRSIGGLLYISGTLLMVYNIYKTVKQGKFVADEEVLVTDEREHVSTKKEHWHRGIESKPVKFMVWSIIVVAIGGIIEIIPTIAVQSNVPTISSVKPYTPLELEGRDIYIREGCNNCHTQMVRPMRFETTRYGEYSKGGEHVYDHPHLWGSKRTGPDLAREGGLRGNLWHYKHMIDPKALSPGSVMPAYPWLRDENLNTSLLEKKINAMRTLGVPYPEGYEKIALKDVEVQSKIIAEDIVKSMPEVALTGMSAEAKVKDLQQKESIALIAYLQRLGTDIKVKPSVN
ncbi:MAG TPA: cytochrome-c oxidase, cbb3-type subunit II, partial [Fluviicola sp.]|nr:cytochrome-c oxidase, cbb3-type subunit II [Fluviicola sp.]